MSSVAASSRANLTEAGHPPARRSNWRKNLVAYSFIAPNFIGFAVFTLGPIAFAFALAFMHWDGSNPIVFAGLDNFARLFTDRIFGIALWNTILYSALSVPLTIVCALALALASCGGGGGDSGGGADIDSSGEAPPDSDTSAVSTEPVTVPDIDCWKKGMAAELEQVRTAGTDLKEAKTADDTLSAMMGMQEIATQETGAKAAGLGLERYKFVNSELSAAVSYLTPQLGGIDTTILSPGQRDELRESNAAQLKQMEDRVPAVVVDALRPRAAELRKRSLELAAERLKSAGV